MAVDVTEQWLATGDVDGTVKVWDISDFCVIENSAVETCPPREYTSVLN